MKTKIVLLLILFCLNIKAQQFNTDSLLKVLKTSQNDTLKARVYIKIASNLQQHNPQKALNFAFKGLNIVKKMNWGKGFAVYYNDIGNNYLDQGKHKEAVAYFLKSLAFSKQIPSLRAITLNNTAVAYFKERNILLSRQYNNAAFNIAQKQNLEATMADCYNIFGQINAYHSNIAKAKAYYLKAYQIWQTQNNSIKQAIILTLLGDITDNLKLKIYYFTKSKTIWDKENPTYLLAISNLFGLVDANISLVKNTPLLKKYRIYKNKIQLLTEAEGFVTAAIKHSKQANVQQNLMYAYGKMSEIKELQGKYKEALRYINLNYQIYISIFSQESKNKIAQIESQKVVDIKNKQIQLNITQLNAKEKQKWYLIASLALLGVIISLLFYQSKNRRKSNEKLQSLNAKLDDKIIELNQANKTKTQFFNILNHDLRSPVANLIDFLYIQKNSPHLLDPNTKNRIENSTLNAAENLLTSMEDILLWSKNQMQNFLPQPKNIFINTIFEDTARHFASEEKVKIVFENIENIQLFTDENYLKTIIRNLTGNAIKALYNVENPNINWRVYRHQNQTILSITDNGQGINQQNLKALYDDTQVTGIKSGLGLHLIRDLASAIQCQIKVETNLNAGTTFLLIF